MLIYNSLSQQKEELKKTRKTVKLFVCGPTVYDAPHIGHARTYVAFDIIVRYLRGIGYKVFYLQNITDVDDKIINRARDERKSPFAIARTYKHAYFSALKKLNVISVNTYAEASRFIKEIVGQAQTLARKGYAYEIPGDGYYFDISKFSDYGKLSKRTAIQAEDSLSRIDEGVGKKNKGDFCLWKFPANAESYRIDAESRGKKLKIENWELKIFSGEPAWNTPFGWGRPGWHIEDTAISESFFGPQYDIHGGGVDLKFPHHEAEITQQEAASGKKPFVKIWMHTGSLLVNGKKMSKSLKNFITIDAFIHQFENAKEAADIFRMMAFSRHYRTPFDYLPALVDEAKKSLSVFKELVQKLDLVSRARTNNQKLTTYNSQLTTTEKAFRVAMEDDFNTPQALAVLFGFVNDVNKFLWSLSKNDAIAAKKFIVQTLFLLGFYFVLPKIPVSVAVLARKRELCRSNKQFAHADALRKKINALGWEVEDTPFGPMVQKNS